MTEEVCELRKVTIFTDCGAEWILVQLYRRGFHAQLFSKFRVCAGSRGCSLLSESAMGWCVGVRWARCR